VPSSAQSFAELVLLDLRAVDPAAKTLQIRSKGKTAVVGVEDAGEWVPLLRLSNPSASFNVMNLDARHHTRWSPTHMRGVPQTIVAALLGPLRFLWEMEASAPDTRQRTCDPEH